MSWFGLPRLVVSWFWMPRACYNCAILDIGGVISCVILVSDNAVDLSTVFACMNRSGCESIKLCVAVLSSRMLVCCSYM